MLHTLLLLLHHILYQYRILINLVLILHLQTNLSVPDFLGRLSGTVDRWQEVIDQVYRSESFLIDKLIVSNEAPDLLKMERMLLNINCYKKMSTGVFFIILELMRTPENAITRFASPDG